MARATCFDLSKLENLAERIYHGQVVFFVGAGFSLDSEGLTGARLLLRLLARFDALTSVLIETHAGQRAAELATRLREVLRSTFYLGRDPEPLTTAAHAKLPVSTTLMKACMQVRVSTGRSFQRAYFCSGYQNFM